MAKTAMAIACHPDDIDFGMSGTLMMLKKAGYEIHYMDVANGSLGTAEYTYEEIVKIRREEAMNAAKTIGAVFHEPLCDDLQVYYTHELLSKLVPIVREVAPEIILTHGPYDYMEDHTNTGRLAVSAAFCRGMQNFLCATPADIVTNDVRVYHSMPHSLTDAMRRPVVPEIYVNVSEVIDQKVAGLVCHISQKNWLDVSQGKDAYITDLLNKGEHFGKLSKHYKYAEGWVRHSHVGFCSPDFNPLVDALQGTNDCFVDPEYEIRLQNGTL